MRTLILDESGDFKVISHLYHFVELLVVAYVKLESRGWTNESIEAVMIPHWDMPSWRGDFHNHNHVLIKKAFPNAIVSTPSEGPQVVPTETVRVDRATLNGGNVGQPHIKYIQQLNPYEWFALFQGEIQHNKKPVVTYVSRQRTINRRLHDRIHARLVTELMADENIVFQEVYMEDHGFEQQLELARNTDVLLGVHGNGLTHAMFMRPKKFVCEIFVPGVLFHWCYYTLSKAMGHEYMCIFDGEAVAPSTFNIGRPLCQSHSLDMLAILGLVQQAKEEILLAS